MIFWIFLTVFAGGTAVNAHNAGVTNIASAEAFAHHELAVKPVAGSLHLNQ